MKEGQRESSIVLFGTKLDAAAMFTDLKNTCRIAGTGNVSVVGLAVSPMALTPTTGISSGISEHFTTTHSSAGIFSHQLISPEP